MKETRPGRLLSLLHGPVVMLPFHFVGVFGSDQWPAWAVICSYTAHMQQTVNHCVSLHLSIVASINILISLCYISSSVESNQCALSGHDPDTASLLVFSWTILIGTNHCIPGMPPPPLPVLSQDLLFWRCFDPVNLTSRSVLTCASFSCFQRINSFMNFYM